MDGAAPGLGASIACGLSHIQVLQQATGKKSAVMICEDDLEFEPATTEMWDTIAEFLANESVDVLCLAANVFDQPLEISRRLSLSQHIITASCYLVKTRRVKRVQRNFEHAVKLLRRTGRIDLYSIDQHWVRIQRSGLIFTVPNNRNNRFAFQSGSSSDILPPA